MRVFDFSPNTLILLPFLKMRGFLSTEGPKKGKGKKCDDFIVGIDKEKSKYYTKGSTTGAKYEEKYFDKSELRCYRSTNKITVTMTIDGDQITTREWSGGGEAGKWDDVRKMTCKEREKQKKGN